MPPMINQYNEDIGTAVLNGKIYICGSSQLSPMTVEVFDPLLNQWSLIPRMNRISQSAKLLSNDGRLFAIGTRENITEMYNPISNQWIELPRSPNNEAVWGVGTIPFSHQLLANIKNIDIN